MTDSTGLDGRVALVTGATSGIGAATARAFAAEGARVVLAGRRTGLGLALVDEIRGAGGEAVFVTADVTATADVERMVATAVDTFGSLDVAFNNAGVFDRAHNLHDYPDDRWDTVLAVNLTAVYRCMKHEIAAMLRTGARTPGGAAIVNNASTVGHRGSGRSGPAYTASKHGVIGLTRQAAVTYVERGVRVNAVSPGPTDTEVAAHLVALGPDAVRAAIAPLNPTGALVGADKVAAIVVFLCSSAAAAINGHAVPADGGQLAKL